MKSTHRAIQACLMINLLEAQAFIIFHLILHVFITFLLDTQQCQIVPLLFVLWSLPGGLFLDLVLAET